MNEVWGSLVEVATMNVGEFITAVTDNGTTETYVVVTNPDTFPEAGQVRVGVTPLVYTRSTTMADTLILAASPTIAAAAGVVVDERVEIWPPLPLKRALVDVGDVEPV